MFDVLCMLRGFSVYHGCKEWLFSSLHSSWQLIPIWMFFWILLSTPICALCYLCKYDKYRLVVILFRVTLSYLVSRVIRYNKLNLNKYQTRLYWVLLGMIRSHDTNALVMDTFTKSAHRFYLAHSNHQGRWIYQDIERPTKLAWLERCLS